MRIDLAEIEISTEDSSPAVATTSAIAMDKGMDKMDNYDGVEAELTSLSWLQSLDITSASGLPTPPCSPSPPPLTRQPPRKLSPLVKAELDLAENAEKYRTDPDAKPPFSYATIICLAMRANNNKVSLSNIYAWIRENFLFYKYADPAWQNSIRHNLSLNKCFIKLPRSKDEPGKGGFWKLDRDRMEEGKRSRRRATNSQRIRGLKRQSPFTTITVTMTMSTATTTTTTMAAAATTTIMAAAVTTTTTMTTTTTTTTATTKLNALQTNQSYVPPTSCLSSTLYETPPSSVSPPIPDSLSEVPESTQVNLSEDDFTNLLIAGWDENNQLELLDLLDTL